MTRQAGIFAKSFFARLFGAIGALLGKLTKVSLITVAVVVVIIVSLLPFVMRWQAVHWLEQQGLKAEIGYINVRPILGSIQINDVRINKTETEQLIIDELQLNIDWMPLLDQELYIEHVVIDGLSIDVVKSENGLRIGGIALPRQNSDQDELGDNGQPASDPALSRLILEKLQLENIQLCYAQLDKSDAISVRQCASFKELALIDHLDIHLGDESSADIGGVILRGFHWWDAKKSLELLGVDRVNVEEIASSDLSAWQVDSLSVESLGVLPTRENEKLVSGDLRLSSLSLSHLDVGGDSSIGEVLLSGVHVDLNLAGQGEPIFSPRLMASLESLLPKAEENKAEASADSNSRLSVGQISLDQLSVTEGNQSQTLLFLNDFNLQKLSQRGSDVVLGGLSVSGLTLLPTVSENGQIHGDLALRKLVLSDSVFGDDSRIGTLSLSGIHVGLETKPNGQLAFAPQLLERLVPASNDQASEKAQGETSFAIDQLVVADTLIRDKANQRNLLMLHQINLSGLTSKGEAVALEKLSLEELKLIEPRDGDAVKADYYFTTPKIELTEINKSPSLFSLKELVVTDPEVFIHRNTSGQFQALSEIERMVSGDEANQDKNKGTQADNTASASSEQAEQSSPTVQFSVGRIKIGSKGQLSVLDESVSPVFKRSFNSLSLVVDNIDSSFPETKSALSFNLGLTKFGYIKFDGTLTPFGEKLTTDIVGELRGLDARALSTYASDYIGYSLDQGIAEADVTFDVKEDNLNAAITTRFRKLEVSALSEAELPEGAESLGIPLDFALGLLRDKNGMIELKLPITGDIRSPDFSLSHIVGKVMFKVISETIVNYYLPFGLIMAATMQDTLSSFSFDPVVFSPGETALDAVAIGSLDKLSDMLNSREQLHLSFCAPATWQDWSVKFAPPAASKETVSPDTDVKSDALQQPAKPPIELAVTPEQVVSLKAMANQRSEAVKEHLVNKGVQTGQVILCEGQFDETNKALPQMNIAI